MGRSSGRPAGLVVALALAGCGAGGDEIASRWTPLAVPPLVVEETGEAARPIRDHRGRGFELVVRDGGEWLETTVDRGDWRFEAELHGGVWVADVALRGTGRPPAGARPQRFEGDGRSFRYRRPPRIVGGEGWSLRPGTFAALADRLLLKLAPGEEPPERARLAVSAARSREVGGRLRVEGSRFTGDGLAVRSGERVVRVVDAPPGSALRFATVLEHALPSPLGAEATFRVRVDGETAFEHAVDPRAPHASWHAVELPPGGRRRLRLAFEIDGPLAYTAFLAPVVGPAEVGGYGGRPWRDPRPDVVVFLADTFRADNMAAYGGRPGVTPFLDALAKRARFFRHAWSTGTYTLPAHATLFAGLFPHQVGIEGSSRAVAEELPTLAELFAAHGWRTGAVTENGMVTRRLGMAQGFEWFDELSAPLADTLARAEAFLDADDGRPAFLFVHTYRTHLPYHVSAGTRRRLGDELGLEGDAEELREELADALAAPEEARDPARVRRLAERLHAFYLGGAADLDLGVRLFHRDLRRRGVLPDAWFLFTSDHGEAFGEHGIVYHTGPVWDELARVPLFLTGPGVEPGVVEAPVSLVDVAPTLADAAGIAGPPTWLGRSLLGPLDERPVFVFECRDVEGSTLAIVEDLRKVVTYEDRDALRAGELAFAFDLASDPDETRDLRGEAAWPGELLGRLGPHVLPLLEPLVRPEEAELDPELLEELRALGYGGD